MKDNQADTAWTFIFKEKKQYFMHLNECDTLRTSFYYHNNTGDIQLIDTVRHACSCTKVSYKHTPIKNGESGKVDIAIDMAGERGYFSKTVVVYFHQKRPVVLKVMGKIL